MAVTTLSSDTQGRSCRRLITHGFRLAFLLIFLPAAVLSQSPPRFPLGERLDIKRSDAPGAERVFEFELEAGTAVDISVGPVRVLEFKIFVLGPTQLEHSATNVNELPLTSDDIYAARISQPFRRAESITIAASNRGTYRLRLVPAARDDYPVVVSKPRLATAADTKLMEASRLRHKLFAWDRKQLKPDAALAIARQRVDIYRELGDVYGLARAIHLRAQLENANGDIRGHIASFKEARSLMLNTEDKEDAFGIDPCQPYQRLGEMQASIHCAHDSVALARSIGLRRSEASMLTGLAFVYHRLGDETRAREYFTAALNIWESLSTETTPYADERLQLLRLLGNMKLAINQLSELVEFYPPRTDADLREGIAYYRQGLELESRYRRGYTGFFLWKIGAATRDLGDLAEGRRLMEQAIGVHRNNELTIALIWLDLAKAHIIAGEKNQARELLQKALPFVRRVNASLLYTAELFIDAGDPSTARDVSGQALELAESSSDIQWMARCYRVLALAERSRGNLENARSHIVTAIELSESLRDRITDDDVRSTYFAAAKKFYDLYIDLLMQMHKMQPDRGWELVALEASERSRSRNMLDLLSRSGVDLRQGVDPKYLEAEKDLRDKIAKAHVRLVGLSSKPELREEAANARRELSDLSRQQQSLEAEIRTRSPRYAGVTPAGARPVGEIQKLVDPGTVMIEFSLGESRSYAWVIAHDRITSAELPPRRDIEQAIASLYKAVARRTPNGGTASSEPLDDVSVRTAGALLSNKLLGPLARDVNGKRLLIVPDGGLHYVPWATLPQPGAGSASLVQNHEIVVLPSGSVLAMLRAESAQRRPAAELVSIFADPVFDRTDARLDRVRPNKPTADERRLTVRRDLDLALSGSTFNGVLPRLGHSRREAGMIGRAAGDRSSINLDFNASKTALLAKDLSKYRILHFATHGLIDNDNAALSGLVLSLVDQKGNDIDGFLRLQDIYNLKLNADLVVLSACETALGKEVRGEGIVGLTRGFMHAGSPRVIASLWKVDDVATAHLMSVFYRKMLVEDMRPAAALRAAQVEMMKQPRWRSPYYWASFILQGEWK